MKQSRLPFLAALVVAFSLTLSSAFAVDKISMDTQLDAAIGGQKQLGKIAEGKKGLLLDFWFNGCSACKKYLPAVKQLAAKFPDLALATVNADSLMRSSYEQALNYTRKARATHGPDFCWLVDKPKNSLARSLKVRSYPHVCLFDSEGKLLFRGHPMELLEKESQIAAMLNAKPASKMIAQEEIKQVPSEPEKTATVVKPANEKA